MDALPALLPGRYRHFKGNEYRLLYVAHHSETMEPMVVYQALYGQRGIWVRPASMWCEDRGPRRLSRPTFYSGRSRWARIDPRRS